MAANTETNPLQASENAILDAVSHQGSAATAVNVIRSVSADQPPAVVREAYWQLIADNRLTRAADGSLSRSE